MHIGRERFREAAQPGTRQLAGHPTNDLAHEMTVRVGVVDVPRTGFEPRVGGGKCVGHPLPVPEIVVGESLADRRHTGAVAERFADGGVACRRRRTRATPKRSDRRDRPSRHRRAAAPTRRRWPCRRSRSSPACRDARAACAPHRPSRRQDRPLPRRAPSRTLLHPLRRARGSCLRRRRARSRTGGRSAR